MSADLDLLERRLDARATAYESAPGQSGKALGVREALALLRQTRAESLPDHATDHMPAMQHSETTQAMRRSALPRSGSLRAEMVAMLRRDPMTDDELEADLGRAHQTVSAARRGLVEQGWVMALLYDDGEPVRRNTRSGNPATVWTLTGHARLRLSMAR